jgi:hypothetical protein
MRCAFGFSISIKQALCHSGFVRCARWMHWERALRWRSVVDVIVARRGTMRYYGACCCVHGAWGFGLVLVSARGARGIVRSLVAALFSSPRFGRCPFGVLVFAMAAPLAPSRRRRSFWFACACAGIRDSLARFTRRPCAGRHLLFFAAAKKSRQKKAAQTASANSCLRAPKGSYASHGNFPVRARCQRSCGAPHPLHAPASHHAVPNSPRPPRWQTVCRPSVLHMLHSRPTAHASHPVGAPSYTTRQPTHSLPPRRHIPFAAACTSAGN